MINKLFLDFETKISKIENLKNPNRIFENQKLWKLHQIEWNTAQMVDNQTIYAVMVLDFTEFEWKWTEIRLKCACICVYSCWVPCVKTRERDREIMGVIPSDNVDNTKLTQLVIPREFN